MKILYIDDNPDQILSEYLATNYQNNYQEYKFNVEDSYDSLLNSKEIQEANIIIIDSQLFENRSVNQKFTGEEIKIILKNTLPFIEVIVITQNDVPPSMDYIVKKYNFNQTTNSKDYYDNSLKSEIDKAIKQIKIYQELDNKLNENKNVNDILKEKIRNSLRGIRYYQELEKKDIDQLIEAFKEFKDKTNE